MTELIEINPTMSWNPNINHIDILTKLMNFLTKLLTFLKLLNKNYLTFLTKNINKIDGTVKVIKFPQIKAITKICYQKICKVCLW